MPEIGFYHLTRTDISAALPALLGRSLAAGERAVVKCRDAAEVAAIDAALWQCAKPEWLPHGTSATPHPEWQPIFVTDGDENPAAAAFLFLIGGGNAALAGYSRVFDLFDGNIEAEVAAARVRWAAAKAVGFGLTYWQQGEAGWERAR
ncbi:MAG: DNA polymerase III subunit chi [Acidocella sp.]|nr:DNA polymerase III subunit chi [Acidocella sp.]